MSAEEKEWFVDRRTLSRWVERAGEQHAEKIVGAFRLSGTETESHLLQIEAIMGWNRAYLQKSLKSRSLHAINAYGLYSLKGGKREIIERYQFLKRFLNESRKYEPERQAGVHAAVRAALGHLAEHAGYSDATHLEMEMEAKLEPGSKLPHKWSVDDYSLEIWLSSSKAWLQVTKRAEPIGSMPAAISKSAIIGEAQDRLDEITAQHRRFRFALEDYMADGTMITVRELETLTSAPILRVLLTHLLLKNTSGNVGLFESEPLGIFLLDGTREPLSDSVCFAHPYYLHELGVLHGWQRLIFEEHIVQPFNQVFRELYLPAQSEREGTVEFTRFAGRALLAQRAEKALNARGWRFAGDEKQLASFKSFRTDGIWAVLHFPQPPPDLPAEAELVSGAVTFKLRPPDDRLSRSDSIPLAEIPPRVFSEAMRDVDHVVYASQKRGDARFSDERYQRRGELLSAFLKELDLRGAVIEGRFARIRGKLASYRVDIGRGTIHFEPGNRRCVIPEGWPEQRDSLFYPFLPSEDDNLVELALRIFNLYNDDLIEDESILDQIQAISE